MTVKEVSALTGVSVRTLQYYDNIGLLVPSRRTEAGYRIYEAEDLARLQQILLFRELEFSLGEIRELLASPDFDREKALGQQIELLRLKKERLENLIAFACGLQRKDENTMSFKAFDKRKQEDYARQARESWGGTEAYAQFERKSKGRSQEMEEGIARGLMSIFEAFGKVLETAPEGDQAQALVKKLQSYITQNYYTCTPKILAGLGAMYITGEFAENIDAASGPGTAAFAAKAIAHYCK